MYQIHGGRIILNWDVCAVIHTTGVCFNVTVHLHIKRTQMPTTQHNTTESAELLHLQDRFPTSRVERGPVRTVRGHANSHAVSTYIKQGYIYKLVKPLRRPEPVTVQNFVTSFLYLRA